MKFTNKYQIGSIITYRPFGAGELRTVLVDEKSDNIKNGRAGFGGDTVDPKTFEVVGGEFGSGVWGYDAHIVSVVQR